MAIIQSRIDYACNFYYHGLPKYLKSRLQVVQNKTLRFVLNLDSRSHLSAADFEKVKWLNIENRVKYLASGHVFNCLAGLAPEYLQVFKSVNNSHQHRTRHSEHSVTLPQAKAFGVKSF